MVRKKTGKLYTVDTYRTGIRNPDSQLEKMLDLDRIRIRIKSMRIRNTEEETNGRKEEGKTKGCGHFQNGSEIKFLQF